MILIVKRCLSTIKKLYTPGPLCTTKSVKEAMMRDMGAGDIEFREKVNWCKSKILEIGGVTKDNYEVVIMQGTGTYGIESVIQATTLNSNKSNMLIIENGFYAKRLNEICSKLRLNFDIIKFNENKSINLNELENYLVKSNDSKIEYTHIGVIQSETSSGVLNDIYLIGNLIKKYYPKSVLIVDSMCCFGAIDFNVNKCKIDFLISSSNKCIQSVPGISFILCNKETLFKLLKERETNKSVGDARSFSLDLLAQYDFYSKHNLFRLTPPTHVLLAFEQALKELYLEGGPSQRYKRISSNYEIINQEMHLLGFKDFVPLKDDHSKIVNCFNYPLNPKFSFNTFYNLLRDNNFIIYSKSLTCSIPTFRIGSIGDLHEKDMIFLIENIKNILIKMNIYGELN